MAPREGRGGVGTRGYKNWIVLGGRVGGWASTTAFVNYREGGEREVRAATSLSPSNETEECGPFASRQPTPIRLIDATVSCSLRKPRGQERRPMRRPDGWCSTGGATQRDFKNYVQGAHSPQSCMCTGLGVQARPPSVFQRAGGPFCESSRGSSMKEQRRGRLCCVAPSPLSPSLCSSSRGGPQASAGMPRASVGWRLVLHEGVLGVGRLVRVLVIALAHHAACRGEGLSMGKEEGASKSAS